ncbi:MAG TPA: transglutaminase-like domain-containing protein [Blastocatellia bacterium]|nr:transglutaminase-like domain-containing protein [Blastocatellia bacterium]
MIKEEARAQLAEMVARVDPEVELDRAALLIAAEEYPELEIKKYLEHLDAFAEQARSQLDPAATPLTQIAALRDLLFGELGFRGNSENYFDARNSFLNDVIDRRMGLPITLSVILIEVGRRIGLKLLGVGMPGHFIVKYEDGETQILIDPFNGGQLISPERCRELIEQMYGSALQFDPSFLKAVSRKQILMRMLQNLKGVYARAMDRHKTLSIIERALLINPEAIAEIRDRGLVYFAMGRYGLAQKDLKEYLRQAPESEDAKEIKEKLTQVQQLQAQLN